MHRLILYVHFTGDGERKTDQGVGLDSFQIPLIICSVGGTKGKAGFNSLPHPSPEQMICGVQPQLLEQTF